MSELGAIGPYEVVRKIGEGGMGVVYAARDSRLDRLVAVKMLREGIGSEQARLRFWREARAAAGVSHPNICQVFEVGETEGRLYLVMELLEGEPLGERLRRGPLPEREAISTALGVLAALDAIHRRELVHRDLKPSNVFLTPHGPKVLDFGLARWTQSESEPSMLKNLTQPGSVLGTPRYMSPEQLQGLPVESPSDIFAAGVLLYEMLAGKPAFNGDTVMAIFHSVLYEPPPPLPAHPHIEPVMKRAMSRAPEARYASATAMAEALRTLASDSSSSRTAETPAARRETRLIVLPFRMLRPDPETEFLAFSLPDAITASLSGLESVVVRSSLVAARFGGPAPDLREVAEQAQVDAVLTGTLLRAGPQIRLSVQLVEAPAGTLVWSQTSQSSLEDIFELQDSLVKRILESLRQSHSTREDQAIRRDAPVNAAAYEFYLRANQLARDPEGMPVARDLYERCLELDPNYAPAWARLGRCLWLMAKWLPDSKVDIALAENAFERAFSINPDLAIAHHLYGRFEADRGRARQAMVRLLHRARRFAQDAELFGGLVHACRYCGLLDASVAAYERARKLDPQVQTSIEHTYFMRGEHEKVIELGHTNFAFVMAQSLILLGRDAEAAELVNTHESRLPSEMLRLYLAAVKAGLGENIGALREAVAKLMGLKLMDLEGMYYITRICTRIGLIDEAVEIVGRSVRGGWCCPAPLKADTWLEPLRARADFQPVIAAAEKGRAESLEAFREAGGVELLGVDG